MRLKSLIATLITCQIITLFISLAVFAQEPAGEGYYRFPSINDKTIVFTSEGDLWKVGIEGGVASRLTTHPGSELHGAISPDGKLVAYTGSYEGVTEAYVMSIDGGLPKRVTWHGDRTYVVGWTPDGRLIYSTRHFSTLPRYQLVVANLETDEQTLLPLAQARYGGYDGSGRTLYFTRLPFQGSSTKRYKGGAAQNIWRISKSDAEATLLTDDYEGTSKEPMWYKGRIYFISDRDGSMNIWSMKEDGSDKKQHTRHDGWDVQTASISNGLIVYQVAAGLYLHDLATNKSRRLEIRLASDFDQKREKWITKPMDWLSSANISHDGDKVALTARGQVFVVPAEKGRLVQATRNEKARYRNALFMPDGKSVLALSDESGELEFWQIPANGVGEQTQLTDNGEVFRWEGIPSPDGKLIAYRDKGYQLWIYKIESDQHTLVGTSKTYDFEDLAWSPDSRWLAYVGYAENQFRQIWIYDTQEATSTVVTPDRFHSGSPAWSPDGSSLYFISDRNYNTIYGGVWGTRQQEPFFDKTDEIFGLALKEAKRSPWLKDDELSAASETDKKDDKDDKKDKKDKEADDKEASVKVEINFDGLSDRLIKVPVPAGSYGNLSVNDKQLIWSALPQIGERTRELQTIKIGDHEAEVKTLVSDLTSYELSGDGKKLLVRQKNNLYVFEASLSKPSDMSENKVDLSGWKFSLDPAVEWRQMFTEAWRLHRDYFYDPGMHGLDWSAILEKYLPLVDRISERGELSNLLSQMVSELETLHTYVYGGDFREGDDDIGVASLGARLTRESSGEYKIDHIYKYDPDYPDELSPLARPDLDIEEGDLILSINGVELSAVISPGELLREQAGQEVLLSFKDQSQGKNREIVVTPISSRAEQGLRYNEWEFTRRLAVEDKGEGQIGYVHLRSTGTDEFGRFARDFYPVYRRAGLIIDNRHNGGGNIDSWIISRLMRKSWSWWDSRNRFAESNMQYAFEGHIAVLCNENTGSDGELLSEGLRRMLGAKVIGTQTWGGEVWLTSSNRLVDRGIATAAEFGVYGPEGQWLIEGHGVDPDIVVLNLPRATFDGEDAQLDAAIEYLQEQIRLHPMETSTPPPYPGR